ncbi:MAG: glycosyltransferase family 1 protein [Verrucomicrobia bacterium]|nr:glycosyltransferase family 1 protein [Verrucomicrobiota bacterium]
MDKNPKPIRALHVVGSLRRGGIETWLMNIIRRRRFDLQIDFLVYVSPNQSGEYEEEALKSGCKIFYAPQVSRLNKRLAMLGLLKPNNFLFHTLKEGKYDVLHVHGEEFLGNAVRDAFLAAVPVRVAHCHSTVLARGRGGLEMWLRWLRHITIDRVRLLRYGTDFVACSRDAGRFLLGSGWDAKPSARVIYCGIPLDAFIETQSKNLRADLLNKYNLPSDAIIVGHAGSMGPTPVKNHPFLVKVFAELAKRDKRYYLFMAGDGPLKPFIQTEVDSLGLIERVRMPGVIKDIPSLMTHLFNVHVMPSTAEGFGITVTEATAAGLASVISDALPAEVSERFSGRTHRLSLSASFETWADQIEKAISEQESPQLGLQRVKQTPLCLDQSIQEVINLYQNRLGSIN